MKSVTTFLMIFSSDPFAHCGLGVEVFSILKLLAIEGGMTLTLVPVSGRVHLCVASVVVHKGHVDQFEWPDRVVDLLALLLPERLDLCNRSLGNIAELLGRVGLLTCIDLQHGREFEIS